MSRLSALAAQPRIALGALLTVLLAAAAVAGSGADFSATSANPSNTFASGTLSIVNSREGTFVLQASNLKPGATPQAGEVDIKNSGSLPGDFTLVRATPVDSDSANPMSQKLNITVVDCGTFSGGTAPACGDGDDLPEYSGTLSAMGDTALDNYTAGEEHRYKFTVQLDGSAGNAYQGDNSSVRFDFNAAQS
jgi:hypothetical protein